jgi:hypothetical protein
MAPKFKGPIAIYPGAKLKKKGNFLNKGLDYQISKIQ